MLAYMAPMDEITTFVFRNAYHRFYAPLDKYFTPFLSPGDFGPIFDPREMTEIDPDNNKGLYVVPQLMVNRSDLCLSALRFLYELGYSEVNLNMGCPSGVVVRKCKGSGMLRDPEQLKVFLAEVFRGMPEGMKVSVKTRIGLRQASEFPALLEVFNQHPLHELILHPRVRGQFYQGDLYMDSFHYADRHCSCPLIFNGELHTSQDLQTLQAEFPDLTGVMLGRGLIENPGLWGAYSEENRKGISGSLIENSNIFDAYSEGNEKGTSGSLIEDPILFGAHTEVRSTSFEHFLEFHEELVRGYSDLLPRESSVVVKMKKLWACWKNVFPEDPEAIRTLLQTDSLEVYRRMTDRIWNS